MEENGKKINAAELFKQWVIKAGVNDWDKIIIENQEEEGIPLDQMDQEIAQFEQQLGGPAGPMGPAGPIGGQMGGVGPEGGIYA
jgi:hypothetical protein